MKCDFCGFEFDEESAVCGCGGCAMSKACNKMKCPNCNYEVLKEPENLFFSKLKALFKKIKD